MRGESRRSRFDNAIIIAGDEHCRLLRDEIARVGGSSIAVTHPLEAIDILEHSPHRIGLVLVPTTTTGFDSREFLTFLRTEYPHVRRVGYSTNAARTGKAPAESPLGSTAPFRLRAALDPVRGRGKRAATKRRPTDRRTGRQLVGAWVGSDRSAFAELARRYRPRILEGLMSSHATADAEDIAQETLLALFLDRPACGKGGSPGALFAELATVAVAESRDGTAHRDRLRGALKRQSRVKRGEIAPDADD